MNGQRKTLARAAIISVSLAAALNFGSAAAGEEAKAAELMPSAQQNAVVQKYCGGCHSDALMYGGLSVEHFDGAHSDPSLAAMLVSKLTNGHTTKDVAAAAEDPDSKASILSLMKNSAMGAAGKGVPDQTTQVDFVKALSAEARGAEDWYSSWTEKPVTPFRTLTASILREVPSTKYAGYTDMYRLILTCRAATHEGEIKLAWANGVPEEGRPITVAVDGKAPFTHKVEGGRKQGNGAYGPGATILYPNSETTMLFPTQTLTIRNLFPDETVVFPFENLSPAVRRDLSACFAAND
jgi:hypothetical protein